MKKQKESKYRIVIHTSKHKEGGFRWSIHLPNQEVDLKLGHSYATLERKSWFFGWHWEKIGTTNLYSVAERWLDEYNAGIVRLLLI